MIKEHCDKCGASMMVNKYTMNRVLVRCMEKLAKMPGQPIREIGLNKSEYSVISKLKHWGFASKTEDGVWHLTDDGKLFMQGRLKTYKEISYFRDKIVATAGECAIFDVFPSEESKQKYREMMEPVFGQLNLFGAT